MILISIEGCDGVGKSTQGQILTNYLQNNNHPQTHFTAEAGASKLGKQICQLSSESNLLPQTQTMFWLALRIEHWHHVKAQQAEIIIYDRFFDSTLVYQAMMLDKDPQYILDLHHQFSLPIPDITFLLTAEIKTIAKRLNQKTAKNSYDSTDLKVIQKRQDCFLELARQNHERIKIIDTENLNNEQTIQQILTYLQKILISIQDPSATTS